MARNLRSRFKVEKRVFGGFVRKAVI